MTKAACDALADEGYYPQFGARPLKCVIQHWIENPFATRILAGELQPSHTITADYQGKTFTFERRESAEEVEPELIEDA